MTKIFLLLYLSTIFAWGSPLLQIYRDIPLPGPVARFDYASFDSKNGLLYLNHMGANEVIVFDTRTNRVLTVLRGFSRCTGILAVPDLGKIFVSTPGRGQVAVINMKTDEVMARLPAGKFPDGIAFDPTTKRIFISDELGRAVTVVDGIKLTVLKRISIGGEAGNTQFDNKSHLVYTNDQTNGKLLEIDPVSLEVKRRIPLDMKGNHGLYIDSKRNLAYIASETEDRLLVMRLSPAKIIEHFRLGKEPDVLAFDSALGRLYVASESGIVSLFETQSGRLKKLGDIKVGLNAHVVATDPSSHLVYFPIKSRDGRPALRIMKQ